MKKLILVTLVSLAAYTVSLAAPVAHTNTTKTEGVNQVKHHHKHHKKHHHGAHAAMNTPRK